MEDETLVRKLLNAVPDRYLQIVASIEQYSDLSEMTLEEAIERLKTYEERIKYKRGKQVDNQEKLMFTRHENKGNFKLTVSNIEQQGVGSKNLDGGVTESMSRPGIKEDIYVARTPIGRQSVGSITNKKHDQSGFMIDRNNEGGSNQKNMINLDLRNITTMKLEVTEEKLIYLYVRMITSTTINQSSSSSNGGFNQKMDQEDLKAYDKAIVIKEENIGPNPIIGLIPICWKFKSSYKS
ncbi:hypothetical protein Tco_0930550 [Tanacetum coccineum]